MDILKAIDIALGMIVVYLVFSLGVTAFNEIVASFLSSRAKWLQRGVAALLTQSSPKGAAFPLASTDAFFRSPFIAMLGSNSGEDKRFAASYIPPWTMLQGLLDAFNNGKTEALESIAAIESAAKRLPEGAPIRAAVESLIAQASGDMEKFRTLVDKWFADFDEQVRSWYRQKTQYVLVLLSAIVAGALNLDTIQLVRQLSVDDKTRSALVVKAVDASSKADLRLLLDKTTLDAAEKELSALQAEPTPANEKVEAARKRLSEEQAKYDKAGADLIKGLSTDGLQLGWSAVAVGAMGLYEWAQKLIGLLLSAAALSLGAPFWFDLLKKVASIRSVGLDLKERAARAAKKTADQS